MTSELWLNNFVMLASLAFTCSTTAHVQVGWPQYPTARSQNGSCAVSRAPL